jgi:hypothetical protein
MRMHVRMILHSAMQCIMRHGTLYRLVLFMQFLTTALQGNTNKSIGRPDALCLLPGAEVAHEKVALSLSMLCHVLCVDKNVRVCLVC